MSRFHFQTKNGIPEGTPNALQFEKSILTTLGLIPICGILLFPFAILRFRFILSPWESGNTTALETSYSLLVQVTLG